MGEKKAEAMAGWLKGWHATPHRPGLEAARPVRRQGMRGRRPRPLSVCGRKLLLDDVP